jgi:hypothetical protein
MAESEVKARVRKEPGLCCTEESDGLPLLFFNVLHTVIAVWREGLPRSTFRPVSMALSNVQQAILSTETILRRRAVLPPPSVPVLAKKSDSSV